jgi:hypothetical protein
MKPFNFEKFSGRLIVVSGIKWKWKAGKDWVEARSETGEKILGQIWKVKKCSSPDIVDRGRWKKTTDGMLTPKDIEEWIKTY